MVGEDPEGGFGGGCGGSEGESEFWIENKHEKKLTTRKFGIYI
jgi:hypothetical protein